MGTTKKHGLAHRTEYRAWQTMRLRCTVPTNPAYTNYGGRGITVCERWLSDVAAFISDMGPKPTPQHELDRIDNNKGYSPENCRWVTRQESCRNRRSNRYIVFQGRETTVAEAIAASGLSDAVVRKRLQAGWDPEQALTRPTQKKAANGCRVKRPPKTNKHGFVGVKYDQQRNKFLASRMVNGKRVYTQRFATPHEAHNAYIQLGQ